MSSTIKVYPKDSTEYNTLVKAAEIMTEMSPRGYQYRVGDCYFDFGQDWMWTTILCDGTGGNFGGYQALYPRAHANIINAKNNDELFDAIIQVFDDKYCPDRLIDEDRIRERNESALDSLIQMYGTKA